MIIACLRAGYKRIVTSVPVYLVSLRADVFHQNGITGISTCALLDGPDSLGYRVGMVQLVMAGSADYLGSSFSADPIVGANASY